MLLSLFVFSLLIATCASFAFLNSRVFSVLGHSLERHKWSFVSSVTTKRLFKSLFYKFFCTSLSQVVLRRIYTERFSCSSICVTLYLFNLFISYKSKKTELIRSVKNRIIHISIQRVATISHFTRSD